MDPPRRPRYPGCVMDREGGMKHWLGWIAAFTIFVSGAPAKSQQAPSANAASKSITIESYYRIKWGSGAEFKQLYERNHAPLLRELQRSGFILSMTTEEPFTHMAGGQRWDLRVTITYRDAEAAVLVGGPFDKAYDAAKARLYPDKAKLDAEEARRFALLEEHWDVIVVAAAP